MKEGKELLKFENINFKDGNTHILKEVTLSIKKGECISLVGASGSGKSTLLKLGSDLISPSSGVIYFKDKSYNEYNPIELRKKISYCIQNPRLFGKTVADNLYFPFNIRKEKVNKNIVLNFLDRFHLNESYLVKSVHSLSGGEKQRVALIRNIIFNPEILLLDEATSALDSKNAKVVEEIVKDLNNQGVTVIWVTHNIEQSLGIFKKRITMERGKITKEEEVNL